jgi:4-amino-4-deoxy-L-arabinose transferase-like glycosyltransferase
MKIFRNPNYQFIFFLFLFFVINVLQGSYTALLEDEAYYWFWSQDMAFGYFDHPPMVALWIKLSSFFFNGEFGLRFMSTLSFSLMLWVIWLMIDFKDKQQHVVLFYLLIVSMAMIQIYGFIITPDTPLVLFTALFLLAYKRFLQEENFLNVVFLATAMAGMLYSKYA